MPIYDTLERPTYQVIAKVSGRPTVQSAHVWTLSELLDNDIPSDAVLSAVETALEVVSSTTKPDVRFHKDTALLIASGDHDQLEAIEHVLDSLDESVAVQQSDEMRQFQMQLQEIDRDRQRARDKLREAEDEVKNARQEAIAMRQEMARLETMLEESKRMLETKDRELTNAIAEVRALQLEVQQLRARSEPGRSNPGR
jgi:septal ring factor EnvC (AmiA/AmiB activator)